MVDYSKWKDIEVSDDEDDTHPNIDTPSLFRWRHQARIERMEQFQKETDDLKCKTKEFNKKWNSLQEKKQKLTNANDLSEIQDELKKLELEKSKLDEEQKQLELKEKKMPWNVDTISKEGFAKTVINKTQPRKVEELTEEEKEEQSKKFFKEHESDIKKFGMLKRYVDSKNFLNEHSHLVCEHTANYLVLWCIDLAIEQKNELMEHVSHQVICMQYILELSKQLEIDPRGCVSMFFTRIQVFDCEYKMAFDDELEQFKQRIRKRADEKIQAIIKETEEEERQKRLGPGGLDPIEVFDTLPEELKKCFESRDIELLKKTIGELPEDVATYHMKRCVDSGLWIPEANKEEN